MASFAPHLYECPMCQLISTDFPYKPEIYDKEYQDKYERYAQTELGRRIEGYRWGFLRRHLNGHRTLVDYGCATGAFLRSEHRIDGIEVDGYDINPSSPYHRDPAWKHPDVITAFDLIEHLPSPRAWIEEHRPRLLILLTPNVGAIHKGLIETWRHYRPDEHYHYYKIESLKALLDKTGYFLEGWDFLEGAHRNPNRPMDLITVAASRK